MAKKTDIENPNESLPHVRKHTVGEGYEEKIVLVDADFLIGLMKKSDAHNQTVRATLLYVKENRLKMRIPVTAAAEAITMLRRREDDPKLCEALVQMIKRGELPIIDVTAQMVQDATDIFVSGGSKSNTFFDAIMIAVYKSKNATAILSFDKWYKKMGCVITEDLKIS